VEKGVLADGGDPACRQLQLRLNPEFEENRLFHYVSEIEGTRYTFGLRQKKELQDEPEELAK
jgi:hypothetical protein